MGSLTSTYRDGVHGLCGSGHVHADDLDPIQLRDAVIVQEGHMWGRSTARGDV
jgi:hypothetical protein